MIWDKIKRNKVSLGLLFMAAALISLGISRGENQDVLQKAIHICLECIGVG